MKNWDNVVLVPEFDEQGVACYRLEGGDYENEYYIPIQRCKVDNAKQHRI